MNCNKTMIAESAIALLKRGIELNDKKTIIEAYDMVTENESFNWDDLDVIYMEWEELVDKGNEILYS